MTKDGAQTLFIKVVLVALCIMSILSGRDRDEQSHMWIIFTLHDVFMCDASFFCCPSDPVNLAKVTRLGWMSN